MNFEFLETSKSITSFVIIISHGTPEPSGNFRKLPFIHKQIKHCPNPLGSARGHTHTHTPTHTVHMALAGYFIVFSFVTKPGQTLEFLLWGTIVPLNFIVGYHCSIVASTPQPMAYASRLTDTCVQSKALVTRCRIERWYILRPMWQIKEALYITRNLFAGHGKLNIIRRHAEL